MKINVNNTPEDMTEKEYSRRVEEEAFSIAIGESPEPTYNGTQEDNQDAVVEDTSSDKTEHDEDNQYDDTSDRIDDAIEYKSIEDDEDTPASPRDNYAKPRTDYKGKYYAEKAKANLIATRLSDLSNQYQQLKNAMAAPTAPTNTQIKSEPEKIDINNLPQELREVVEDYPGVMNLVQYAMNHAIGSTRDKLTTEVESKLNPLHTQLRNMEMDRARSIVETAHPDVVSILGNEDFAYWVAALPTPMRNTMLHIYNNGTVEETIWMLNEYKQAKGITNAENTRRSSRNLSASAQNQNSPRSESRKNERSGSSEQGVDDSMVRKLQASLAVPSRKAPVNIENTRRPASMEDAFNAVIMEDERNRQLSRRR